MSEEKSVSRKKTLQGVVVKTAMEKTVTVQMTVQVKHPQYRKYVRKSKKLLAHDEEAVSKVGDTVRLEECRPISKRKFWTVKEVVQRAAI